MSEAKATLNRSIRPASPAQLSWLRVLGRCAYPKLRYSPDDQASRIRPCQSWPKRRLGAAGDEQPDTIEDAGEPEVEGLALRTGIWAMMASPRGLAAARLQRQCLDDGSSAPRVGSAG